jgi:hypothetical protein
MADLPGTQALDPTPNVNPARHEVDLPMSLDQGPGGGGGSSPTTVDYLMRAYRALTPDYVYWTASGAPDYAGTGSGYNPGDLTDITVVSYS